MATTPIVVTVERAWKHIHDVINFAQRSRVRHAQAFTYQIHREMSRF